MQKVGKTKNLTKKSCTDGGNPTKSLLDHDDSVFLVLWSRPKKLTLLADMSEAKPFFAIENVSFCFYTLYIFAHMSFNV